MKLAHLNLGSDAIWEIAKRRRWEESKEGLQWHLQLLAPCALDEFQWLMIGPCPNNFERDETLATWSDEAEMRSSSECRLCQRRWLLAGDYISKVARPSSPRGPIRLPHRCVTVFFFLSVSPKSARAAGRGWPAIHPHCSCTCTCTCAHPARRGKRRQPWTRSRTKSRTTSRGRYFSCCWSTPGVVVAVRKRASPISCSCPP